MSNTALFLLFCFLFSGAVLITLRLLFILAFRPAMEFFSVFLD